MNENRSEQVNRIVEHFDASVRGGICALCDNATKSQCTSCGRCSGCHSAGMCARARAFRLELAELAADAVGKS